MSKFDFSVVLILIVVDNGLVLKTAKSSMVKTAVLILVVVDDGLVLVNLDVDVEETWCLNPYCSGQWSRTEAYEFH